MRKILIILHRQVGDVLLATPMIQHLKSHHQTDNVYWVAHPMAKAILDNHPGLSGVFYLPQPPKGKRVSLSYFVDYLKYIFLELKFILHIRRAAFSSVVDAMCNPRSSLQCFLSGAPLKVGFKTRAPRNWVYNKLISRESLSNYLGWSRLNLLEPLGCPVPPRFDGLLPTIPLRSEHHGKIDRFISENKIIKKRFVLLSPCGRRSNRWWPHSYFQGLARLLCLEGVQVVWLWGPGEKEEVKEIHVALQKDLRESSLGQGIPDVPSIFPENLWNLNEVAAACSQAMAWVGVTNGLAKCALAVRCPTVEIHGPTCPTPWTYPDKHLHRSVQRQVGCVNCEKNYCVLPVRECLDHLTVEEVFQEVKDLCQHFREKDGEKEVTSHGS